MKSKLLSMIVALCVLLSCVTIPAQAAGLTEVGSTSKGLLKSGTDTSTWLCSNDENTTTSASAGIGGKAVGDEYTLYDADSGTSTGRGACFMNNTPSTVFAQKYFVFTGNFYGTEPVTVIARREGSLETYIGKNVKDFVANQWNNVTVIYDTKTYQFTVYVNGVVKFDQILDKDSAGKAVMPTASKGQFRVACTNRFDGNYIVDDLAIYKSTTAPTFALPTLSEGTNYTVADNAVTLTGAATVADLVPQTGATVRAYTDSTLATTLGGTAALAEGNYVVVEAPFDAATEDVKVYNYYSVGAGSEGGEGGEGGEDPEPEVPEGISGKLPDNANVTWSYDEEEKVLSFEGTGEMTSWINNNAYEYSARPWKDYADSIVKVVIGEGITSIGSGSFREFTNLTEIEFPEKSLKEIKGYAFAACNSLKEVVLPASVDTIGEGAFKVQKAENAVLESFTFRGNPSSIHNTLFDNQGSKLVIYTKSANTKVLNMAKTKTYDYVLLDKEYEIVYDADKKIATARNFTKSPVDVAIIVASYGSGYLDDVDFTPVTIPAAGKEGKKTLTFTGTHVPGGYVKAMLWNNFTDATPLTVFHEVDIAEK